MFNHLSMALGVNIYYRSLTCQLAEHTILIPVLSISTYYNNLTCRAGVLELSDLSAIFCLFPSRVIRKVRKSITFRDNSTENINRFNHDLLSDLRVFYHFDCLRILDRF